MAKHPRDTYISVYGRKPVLEVLEQMDITIAKVCIAKKAKGDFIDRIVQLCEDRAIECMRVKPEEVSRISKNPKQDQGAVADVVVPNMALFSDFFDKLPSNANIALMALDGVTTPANVGLIIRTCTAMGMDGILIPRKGCAKISPLVIKASAGVVFKSTLLNCERLVPALKLAKKKGFTIYGLSGYDSSNIYTTKFVKKSIFILGNESNGMSPAVAQLVDERLQIPMFAGVESLNVACAGAVVASEILRHKQN